MTPVTDTTHDGGCLCGRIRYRVSGPVRITAHCHCSMCRLGSGAPMVTWTVAHVDDFAWTAADPAFYTSSEGCLRSFCPTCGSKLTFTDASRPEDVDIAVGSLDDAASVRPEGQIFGRSKVAWLNVDPHVPFRPKHKPGPHVPMPPPTDDETLEGGCLCGAVRYAVTGPPDRSAVCHCGTCRRETGGPFTAWGIWPRDRFQEISGETTGYASSETGVRRFCSACGATVYFESLRNPAIAEIMLAGLDAPGRVSPPDHAFAADAVPDLVLADDRPRWPGRIGDGEANPSLLQARPGNAGF